MNKANFVVAFGVWMSLFSVDTLAAERDRNELHLLASNAGRPAISALVPLFEKNFDAKVQVQYANNPILKQQIEAGAKFDIVIIEPKMLQDLVKGGFVAENSVVSLATIGMALVSKEGAPSIDIGTVDSFKKVLLSAKSIAYTADGNSGAVFLSALEQLGIAEEMKPKLMPVVGRLSTLAVADGSAQYTAFPLAGSVPGVQMAGMFPESVQTYIGISVATKSGSVAPLLQRQFLDFLQSESAKVLFKSMGFTPSAARQK